MSGLRGTGWVLLLVMGLVLAAGPARSGDGASPTSEPDSVISPGTAPGQPVGPVTIRAAGRGGPSINLRDGRALPARFDGPADLAAVLQDGRARPTALASGDFDDDGMPDVVCAFEYGGRGIVSIHRGNVDLLFPNAPDAQRRRAEGTLVEDAFLPDARVFATPQTPDLLGVGDFDADGRLDLVVASLGDDKLNYHRGDGDGALHAATGIPLPGRITALTAGDVNRRDWMNDLLVGVETDAGPRLLVMEGPDGAAHDDPEVFVLPEPATQVVLGQFDREAPIDYAVAAGRNVLVMNGRDRHPPGARATLPPVPPARIKQVELPEKVLSLAVGRFDDGRTRDLAVIDAAGFLRIAPAAEPERLLQAEPRLHHAALDGTSGIVTAKVSSRPGDDLLTLGRSTLHLQSVPGRSDYEPAMHSADLAVEGRPVAILPMRLNADALNDLVVLTAQPAGLSTIVTDAATVITVRNTNDGGKDSLRDALFVASPLPGLVEIRFDIPGPPPYVIQPTIRLPDAIGSLFIDGTSQPGYSGWPVVYLDGTLSVEDYPNSYGLQLAGTGTAIRGLGFTSWLGVDTAGLAIAGGGTNHFIEANMIGVRFDGLPAPNTTGIILNQSGESITIGGTAHGAGNLISGNSSTDIWLIPYDLTGAGSPLENTQILGNAIGIDPRDTTACIPSPYGGIWVDGYDDTVSLNTLIGSPTGEGGNTIACVNIAVILNPANVISGSSLTGTVVLANRIGTDLRGALPLPVGRGVDIEFADGNQVGSTFSGSGNQIIADIDGIGVNVYRGSGNRVDENLIGVNATGTASLGPVCRYGIDIGTNATGGDIDDNVVGNCETGIRIYSASSNLVTSNAVGTDRSGSIDLGNMEHGIRLRNATSNEIGNLSLGGNRIANNGEAGIQVDPDSTGNPISQNSIYGNSGLGIDLEDPPGVTPNDPGDTDTGGNNLQNFPVLSFAGTTGVDINLVGTLNSAPGRTYDIELFSNTVCDPSGHGEGETSLGTTPVLTDPTGNGSFDVTFGGSVPVGYGITATATSPDGDTSEFSACLGAAAVAPAETTGMNWTPGSGLSWDPVPGALGYNFYRGNHAVAPALANGDLDSCLQLTTSNTTSGPDVIGEDPQLGGLFVYLITAYNGVTEGTAGDGTHGPRQLDSAGDCVDACPHDVCLIGDPLSPVCSGCVAEVCAQVPDCCDKLWDQQCLLASDLLCGTTCY